MTANTLMATAEKLLAHVRANTTKTGLDELYHPDAVSVEAVAAPDAGSAEVRGVEAIRGKHDWWDSSMEVHSASADGPFPHGDDRFALIFAMDFTEKASGKRSQMQEVAIYTVDDAGKIVREEFYYNS